MTLPPIFSDEYYAHWRDFDAHHWWSAGMRDVAAGLMSVASLPADGLMLDVGCGSGQGMHWLAGIRPRWKMLGLDLGMDGLQAAKRSGMKGVALGTATSLPIGDSAVDLVITLDLLQHLPLAGGDHQALHEMHRVLKPGGHLFIRTNVQSFPRVEDDPDAVWHMYDVDELHEKVRHAGFTVVRLSRINAVLGLAEIPQAIRARGAKRDWSYNVVTSAPRKAEGMVNSMKRGLLRFEGRAVQAGISLPVGRTLVALCRRD